MQSQEWRWILTAQYDIRCRISIYLFFREITEIVSLVILYEINFPEKFAR